MRSIAIIFIGVLMAVTGSASAQASRGALARGSFAITGVNVIPMSSDTVFRNATVLVENGRITAVGPARTVRLGAGVRTIDETGKYLIPGLADMHAHLYSDGEVADSLAPYELAVFLANGITTARMMIGTPEHFPQYDAD